jgi:hypothetical protein
VCSFLTCVTPGNPCQDASDCPTDHYCELALGSGGAAGAAGAAGSGGDAGAAGAAGAMCVGQSGGDGGKCLPLPPVCPGGAGGAGGAAGSAGSAGSPGDALTCLEKCEVVPPTIDFTPTLKYAWGGKTTAPFASDIMMTPIVIELDDDDCDGKITARDIPEIVFVTFASGSYNSEGTVTAISIVNGQVVEKWKTPGLILASSQLAAGNIDGEPGNEIVGCGTGGVVYALNGDGTLLWTSSEPVACSMPSIADIDGDGAPEVVVNGGIFDGKTGVLKQAITANETIVVDIDNDGQVDIVTANKVLHADGSVVMDTGKVGRWPAVGDLDNDGVAEVVGVDPATHRMTVWHANPADLTQAEVVRDSIDINGMLDPSLCPAGSAGNTKGGGPVTIADFNADGFADVALAGGIGYAVFDGKKLMDPSVAPADTFLWIKQTHDCSSAATGSSLFDFNGDGKAEVLYSDEFRFHIYEGATGNVLYETCNTTGTLIEYPVVADVDNDGQADIIVASNAYAYSCDGTKQSGIRVFGSASGSWVRTRRVWNQHGYHITNVNEDGSIPAVEASNWKQPGLNNFRINKQPGSEFAAPDITVSVRPECSQGDAVAAVVRNLGQVAVAPGVQVDFYKGEAPSGTLIGSVNTTLTLYLAQAESVVLPITDQEIIGGGVNVYAVATPPASVKECRTDNNTSPSVIASCKKF